MRLLLFLVPALLLAGESGPVHKKASVEHGPALVQNYKEFGSPNAPITLELYTDYSCPSCRAFYMQSLPALTAEFVNTNRVRIVHRDFPLPQHQFSRLAARYANAAGEIGKYEVVAAQIFKTQPEWDQNGAIEPQVAKVLSPAEMAKVKELMKTDSHLDDTVAKDVAIGNQDGINQTPSMVLVRNGKREVIAPIPPYTVLKSYLTSVLARR
jgi:protein-disulfide isomerase